MSFSGGCSCGAVRFTIAAEPVRGFQCQCRDCQRDTGGGHSSVFVFPRSAVDITGEVCEISRSSDSGAMKRKGFCGNCGVPIYNKPDEKPEFIGIYVGSLDDATALLTTAPLVTPAKAEGVKMAQGVDVQIGRDRDRYDRDRRYDRETTVGVGPGGVTVGPRERCRMVTTRVERDDGSSFTRRERRCD